MASRLVPPGTAEPEARIEPVKVWYDLWYVPFFPVQQLGGRLDKDVEANPWLLGLLEDIRSEGRLRNPVVVWNHHAHRLTGKQPAWMLRAGSNRIWCVEQLGWEVVPAVVSTARGEFPPASSYRRIYPTSLDAQFPDGGVCWANEHGWGLLQAKKPEVTYANYTPDPAQLAAIRPTNYGMTRWNTPFEADIPQLPRPS